MIVDFRIADTFTASLARLTGDEQRAVKTTAFDLQMNPANPGMSFHKLGQARDKNFWSVRVSSDIRLIVHRTDGSLLLCYVDHHDNAYDWAERRKLETHPKTGAAQMVEVRETVRDVVVPNYVQEEFPEKAASKPLLFTSLSDDELLGYGVPAEWMKDVREADEDSVLALADHLPAEAGEALLELATGGHPVLVADSPDKELISGAETHSEANQSDPFAHPDAQRRFRLIETSDALKQALDYPWEQWTVFLHPEQRRFATHECRGPTRVSGSAGTGKTVVALHRAAHLARENEDGRVLLTTFSKTLAKALQIKLRRLLVAEPRLGERIDVYSLQAIAERLHVSLIGPVNLVGRRDLRRMIKESATKVGGHKFSQQFLISEWDHVVDAWQLNSWDEYREVRRLGRKTRLPENQRKMLWAIYEKVKETLKEQALMTVSEMFAAVGKAIQEGKNSPFQYIVIDEAQDLSVSQLMMLAAMGAGQPEALYFAGDLGQRIFQQPFSWRKLGVDIRGRSKTLRVNYRTSHQIRARADRLLAGEVSDADGIIQDRRNTVSVFNGPAPIVAIIASDAEEVEKVSEWLKERSSDGVLPHEIGVFTRSSDQIERAQSALKLAGIPSKILDDDIETTRGFASICTMHLAKGLEFRAVVVMACDDEVIPLQSRIEEVGDEGDLQEAYDTERQLLYVACTRARDFLWVSGVEPASEFLDDLKLE